MSKVSVQNLAHVFGWMNVKARDIADSLGNRIASAMNIALVLQAAGKTSSLQGAFEMATQAMRMMRPQGSSGRPFRPFPMLPERQPS
jgi:hypothetical protein